MEYDDVRALDLVWGRSDIEKLTVDPIGHPRCRQQVSGAWLVALRDLEVRYMCRATTKQLDLDLTQAPTYLKDRGTLQAALGQEADQLQLSLVQAPLLVSAGDPSREPITKRRLIAVARLTALAHGSSIGQSGSEGPPIR
jgi:hypothetical protein